MILEKIEKKARCYNLEYVRLNETTLRIHRQNMLYDSWLVIHEKGSSYVILKHKCKLGKVSGCKEHYHLQKKIRVENWIWVLQRIDSHYRYKTGVQRQNLIDRILEQYHKERNVKYE